MVNGYIIEKALLKKVVKRKSLISIFGLRYSAKNKLLCGVLAEIPDFKILKLVSKLKKIVNNKKKPSGV